jgi:Na+/melibiose symporter-like transporter
MKFLEIWKGVTDSLGTQGGSLLLLTFILMLFFPMLLKNDPEGWKAAMFILGIIAGAMNVNINARKQEPLPPPTPPVPPTPPAAIPDEKQMKLF